MPRRQQFRFRPTARVAPNFPRSFVLVRCIVRRFDTFGSRSVSSKDRFRFYRKRNGNPSARGRWLHRIADDLRVRYRSHRFFRVTVRTAKRRLVRVLGRVSRGSVHDRCTEIREPGKARVLASGQAEAFDFWTTVPKRPLGGKKTLREEILSYRDASKPTVVRVSSFEQNPILLPTRELIVSISMVKRDSPFRSTVELYRYRATRACYNFSLRPSTRESYRLRKIFSKVVGSTSDRDPFDLSFDVFAKRTKHESNERDPR